MKLVSRRVVVGALSATVVAATAGISTWALADETPSAPVRLVVGLKQGADAAAPMRTVSAMGVRSVDAAGPAQQAMSELRAQTLEVSQARRSRVVEALKSDPNVAYVEVDHVRKAYDVHPNDPMYVGTADENGNVQSLQPEVDQVNLPAAWETTTGDAVKIAVLDTGVAKVGDLSGAVLGGYNYVSNTSNTADDFGHGTTVASLIAARGNNGKGMAGGCWSCMIIPVKVLDKNGSGYDSNIAKGIVYATNNGAKIINMSLGGTENSKVLADAVSYANLKGVLVVAAAGNAGNTQYATTKQYPAAYPDVVAVGATARNSDDRADFSSYNKSGDSWVDMAAPGIVTGMDRFENYHTGEPGTSFAAPMVSGAAGLVKTVHPDYTAWSLQRALLTSARSIGADNGWAKYGMLDAAKALTVGTDTTAPTITGVSTPGEGWRVHGKIPVKTTGIADNWSGVRNVDLFADGVYKAQDRTAPYEFTYDTGGKNGKVKLEIKVYDKAGNRTIFTRSIIADNVAPTVTITSGPASGTKVTGTVKLAATASDTNGIRKVEMLINGSVKATDTTSPYNFSFKASSYASGMKVQIRATDNAGNVKSAPTRTYKR
ncbi:S8 family serine peptidase [Couchioplanes caeruleus]|uniref:S8 family serine peptidase n=1 Tax=Couchioplanes caeruleus TaxID=56438 RepID=UPI00201C3705|nr:S8 family serine peptidase [Couchioplanes caeruleus]UQU64086.1 S8 family serine peptidase [Couchioplanes caeruleus]